MKTNLSPADVTPAVKSAASAVLVSRAYAETMRARKTEIETAILAETPLYVATDKRHNREAERITDPGLVWLTDLTSPQYLDHIAEVKKRVRAAGLHPDDMPEDHCPACVAECVQRDAEHLLIEAAAEMLGAPNPKDFRHKLLCSGMAKYRKFIDLLCSLVISLPDFRNPLTGQPRK
jgi:hypothetical protein